MPRLGDLAALVLVLGLPTTLLTAGDRRAVSRPSASKSQALAKLSGAELIQRLFDDRTRLAAYRELSRRGGAKNPQEYTRPEVVVCPQGKGRKPIYVVLSHFLDRCVYGPEDYAVERPEELFPHEDKPFRPPARFVKRDDLLIEAFTADGECIRPFGGSNVLSKGLLTDINGDGLVERADYTNYGIDGVRSAQVLTVWVVRQKPSPILRVLYNWGDREEWDYEFADLDNGETLRIQFGPKCPKGIIPKVVFRWDPTRKAYVGSGGKAGDHFRVLGPGEAWDQLQRLKAKGLPFARDPDYVPLEDRVLAAGLLRRPTKAAQPRKSKPYRYASLRGLSDERVVGYMADGRSIRDFEAAAIIRTHVPKEFWTLPAREAALAMADANRTPAHRNRFAIAVDDRDRRSPPDIRAVRLSYRSARCYNAIDSHYFLRIDPKSSYFAYAQSWEPGVVFYNFVSARAAYDIRFCELPYRQARQVAETIWWLHQVRTWEPARPAGAGGSTSWCSADGHASLRVVTVQARGNIQVTGSSWAEHIPGRWQGHYGKETFLNLAKHLVTAALPKHLGEGWARSEPRRPRNPLAGGPGGPKYRREDGTRLRATVKRILGFYSPDQGRISYPIVREAVRAAGDLALADVAGQVRRIQSQLPAPLGPKRTEAAIEKEIERAQGQAERPGDYRRVWSLYEELDRLRCRHDDGSALEDLRGAVQLTLRQSQVAHDPKELMGWAVTGEPGWQWALQRLRELDRDRYVFALEQWLKKTKGKWTRQALAAIAEVDPDRAKEIAKKLSPDAKGDLTVPAFSLLTKAKAIPDEQKRVAALVKVALDPKSGWDQRGQAIDHLVPASDPLKYRDRKVDEALLRLLDPKLADDTINFTLAVACRALALRGRTEYFDRITERLDTIADGEVYHRVLGALTQLARKGGAEHKATLISILKPHLKRTNKMITEIVWCIWAADLRALKADLESIATAGPGDYEGPKASSHGGGVTPVTHRYHLARKIAAIWNEEDSVTRGRLLVAFGFHEAYYVASSDAEPERVEQLTTALRDLAGSLSAEQTRQVVAFLKWCEGRQIDKERPGWDTLFKANFANLVRTAFRLPKREVPSPDTRPGPQDVVPM